MNKLPLVRVAEVAFLASNVKECVDFYGKIGMVDLPASPGRLNFAHVGEQLYGVCDGKTGFLDPWTGGYSKNWKFHVAFEVPYDKLDECVEFLKRKGINVSPKEEWDDFHDVAHSTSIYFPDPAGNIIELWAPKR
jgi:catechol 2,3-dioxygenase-like lactoylglutathione lyase family enzyme